MPVLPPQLVGGEVAELLDGPDVLPVVVALPDARAIFWQAFQQPAGPLGLAD